ncbi:MAG: iron-containing alcohol dehydrogenase [Clostridium sp.]|jgi:alcohol dehydrogenase class IV|nr:iron-containing alcohol dehydrogenase [Clostridium sp.]
MLTSYNLKMPGAVYGGENALHQIAGLIGDDVKRIAVFTDQGVAGAGLLEAPLEQIRKTGKEAVIFDDLAAEPTYEEAQAAADRFKDSGADFIVAVGGGSVMDAAKLASVLATDAYGVKELLDHPGIAEKYVRTLMIPTTAGTGAEATPNAIVAVPEKELKVGIVNDHMIADYVILDAAMIKKLPAKIAASTGVDALCHAIECFTSNKKNPFSDLYALQAFEMIMKNIEKACADPDALEEKQNMLLASFYAGVAITASGTTAVHALSYPLGGKYHIPHGVSNAMLLAPVMRFNEPVCRRLFAEAYDRLAPEAEATAEEQKSGWVVKRMEEIVERLHIPTSLKEFGIGNGDLDSLVEAGMGVQRLLGNNMRPVTAEDARKLYLEIM